MDSYASMAVLPVLQIASIVILAKKLRGSRALVFGVIAVGCWMLSGLVAVIPRSATKMDMITIGTILSLSSLAGWISFIVMAMNLPVRGAQSSGGSETNAATEHPDKTHAHGTGPNFAYRYGRIGAFAGFAAYMLIAGIGRLSDGDILASVAWGFVSGFVGGGAGAALGILLEKHRS